MVRTINTNPVRLKAANDTMPDIAATIELTSTELPYSNTIIEADLVTIETYMPDIVEQLMADAANDTGVSETASLHATEADPED